MIVIITKTFCCSNPVSLWVGRDCAKNLFGCEVEGEAEYSGREVK